MHGPEVLGEPLLDDDTGGEAQQVRLVGRILPGRDASLGHVGLVEEERHEFHVPGGAGFQAVEEVLMAVSGKRAPIVPGHGKCLTRLHTSPTPGRAVPFRQGGQTSRLPTKPNATPMAAPPTTSEAWWARRWSRLTPTSAAPVKSRALPARS